MLADEGLGQLQNFEFPLDGQTHCNEWYTQYWLVILTIMMIAMLIIFGNVLVEVAVQAGSGMTRPVNE